MFPNFNSCDKIKGSLEYNKRMIGMAAKKEGWTLIGRAKTGAEVVLNC